MKKLIAILFATLAATSFAQTAKTRAQLYTDISTTLASGTAITAAQARSVLRDIVESSSNPQTDGATVTTSGTYADPTWLSELHYSKITNKPTSIAGLGVLNGAALDTIAANGGAYYLSRSNHSGTQAISTVVGLQAALDAKAATTHTHTIADTTGLQTALDGKAASSHSHTIANTTGLQAALDAKANTSSLAAVATSGAYSSLTGTPTLGTAAALNVPASGNAASGEVVKGSDTRLTDARTPTTHTHTAMQVSDSTTTGRAVMTAVDAAAARTAIGAGTSSFSGAYTDLSGKPTLGTAAALDAPASGDASAAQVVKGSDSRLTDARTPTTHTHTATQISDSTSVGRAVVTAASQAAARSAIGAGTSDFDGAYGSLTGTPSTFAPSAHASSHASAGSDPITIAQSQVTNLTTDLAAKAPTTRTITTQHSIDGGGDLGTNRTINLVNDTASPGANKVYGTDGSGNRGWKDDPTGGSGLGYTLRGGAGVFSPGTSGITRYIGCFPSAAPQATEGLQRLHISKAGTLKIAHVWWWASGVAGSGENVEMLVRHTTGGTPTDYSIATVGDTSATKLFSNTGLSITVAPGDWVELKMVYAAHGTGPTNVFLSFIFYVE